MSQMAKIAAPPLPTASETLKFYGLDRKSVV